MNRHYPTDVLVIAPGDVRQALSIERNVFVDSPNELSADNRHPTVLFAVLGPDKSEAETLIRLLLEREDIDLTAVILASFCDRPATAITGVDQREMLGLLFEAIDVAHVQLPATSETLLSIAESLSVASIEERSLLQRDLKRLRIAAGLISSDTLTAWHTLSQYSADASRRLHSEHDIKDDLSLLSFQRELNVYYLATARHVGRRRRFLVIDDYSEGIMPELILLTRATGDIFHATKDKAACVHVLSEIRRHAKGRSIDPTWIVSSCVNDDVVLAGDLNLDYDAVFIDLLLGTDESSGLEMRGEVAVRYLQDWFPQLPVFVLTKSEEPDVLARCIKYSGADRVIPKRRLLRLPHVYNDYIYADVSLLLRCFENDPFDYGRRLLAAFRTWTACPGILWHGEKTFHAAEHTLEHHKGLWNLANDLLVPTWQHLLSKGYNTNDLFRFLMSLWLHDIGCQGDETHQLAHKVRSVHSWISGRLIKSDPAAYDLTAGVESRVVELLCAYHQSCAPFDEVSIRTENEEWLFEQTLEEIERDEGPSIGNILEWAALLRLLDAIEHNWRRVGGRELFEAKLRCLERDGRYYSRQESSDEKQYAEWLSKQEAHMKKHMAVLDVRIKVIDSEDGTKIFWPEYLCIDRRSAREYVPRIGVYGLQEWWSTGRYIAERMGMVLSRTPPSNWPTDGFVPVWNAPELDAVRGNPDELEKEARRIWCDRR